MKGRDSTATFVIHDSKLVTTAGHPHLTRENEFLGQTDLLRFCLKNLSYEIQRLLGILVDTQMKRSLNWPRVSEASQSLKEIMSRETWSIDQSKGVVGLQNHATEALQDRCRLGF